MLLNNRYRIIDTLGRGGFGETYLVEDRHLPSKRKCVLKQLNPIVEQPEIPDWMKERFQREAAILEELGEESQQIPRLYAYFAEEGKFYLVQEWIEGETLAQKHQRQGNLNPRQVQAILVQLLPVLDFLHQRQIIHRDLKPENIILRHSDRKPVLIDFGAVKEAMSTKANHNSNSSLSISIGTPGYMSSEQAAGRPAYSSDLYSLGLTAIFLLTGKAPQDLESNPETGEIIWQEYAANLDPKLVLVLDKAIKFHPRDRFNSATAMLSALQNTQQSYPTIQVAPAAAHSEQNNQHNNYGGTVHYETQTEQPATGNNRLVKILFFLLTLVGLGIGTFTVGFTIIANLFTPIRQSLPQAKIETDDSNRRPVLFPPINENKPETEENSAENIEANPQTELETPELAKIPKASQEKSVEEPKVPEIFIQTQPKPKANKTILTTGISETQLVSTLGKPTSQRTDARENSKVLEYRDAETYQIHSRYKSNTLGKIYYTEVILDSSVSLGQMQAALDKLLGNNNSAPIKDKLRAVYNRESSFSFFSVGNKKGKIERDSKNRISISVEE